MDYRLVDDAFEEISSIKKEYKGNYVIVTDRNIYKIYRNDLDNYINRTILIDPGEENKNIDTLKNIYEALIELKVDRNTILISLGGGVVGDIAGYASATFKRGLEYIQVPTSLLAQTDSSIGGKTAIDFKGYKNIIGAFYFPKITLIDINFLKSLDERDLICGYGEVVKYGLIYDYDFFKNVIKNKNKLFTREDNFLKFMVEKSIEIKSKIVIEDRFDTGLRQSLNFGHTIGHGLESYFNYEKFNHGEAVMVGMVIESFIAYRRKLIGYDYYFKIYNLLGQIVNLNFEVNKELELLDYIREDKKNTATEINMVLPVGKGKVDIFPVEEQEIIFAINNFRM